jgi:ribosomal-protein-alanine N-acetyltransferase
MTEIETERLFLFPWNSKYLDGLVHIFTKTEVTRYIAGGRPLSRDDCLRMSERWSSLWDEHGYGPWAALEKISGRLVGRMGLDLLDDWPQQDKWEVGWELDPEFWGQGLATEGGRAGVRFGFEKAKLKRIISVTVPENAASRRVMEKCGLIYQGLIRWRGAKCVWYAIDAPAVREGR